jgi:hypothetical protein
LQGKNLKELIKAIYAKNSGSALDAIINGRFYYGKAPEGTRFPYVVFFRVAGHADWTFTEYHDNSLIQFSVFSAESGSASEVSIISEAVRTLFDKCKLSVTGETFLYMWLSNITGPMEDDTVSQDGAEGGWACHLDFDVKTQL